MPATLIVRSYHILHPTDLFPYKGSAVGISTLRYSASTEYKYSLFLFDAPSQDQSILGTVSRRLAQRREWELWSIVLIIGIVVSAGLLVFSFPSALVRHAEPHVEFQVPREMLLGLVCPLGAVQHLYGFEAAGVAAHTTATHFLDDSTRVGSPAIFHGPTYASLQSAIA
jgi:hypothetical protein